MWKCEKCGNYSPWIRLCHIYIFLTFSHFLSQVFMNPPFQSSQLSQSSQSADSSVPGIAFFCKIVEHLMTVIGTHGDGCPSFFHEQYNLFHNFRTRAITFVISRLEPASARREAVKRTRNKLRDCGIQPGKAGPQISLPEPVVTR